MFLVYRLGELTLPPEELPPPPLLPPPLPLFILGELSLPPLFILGELSLPPRLFIPGELSPPLEGLLILGSDCLGDWLGCAGCSYRC